MCIHHITWPSHNNFTDVMWPSKLSGLFRGHLTLSLVGLYRICMQVSCQPTTLTTISGLLGCVYFFSWIWPLPVSGLSYYRVISILFEEAIIWIFYTAARNVYAVCYKPIYFVFGRDTLFWAVMLKGRLRMNLRSLSYDGRQSQLIALLLLL